MFKKIDIHCHVIGGGTDINKVDEDVYFNSEDNQLLFTRVVESLVRKNLNDLGGVIKDGRIQTASYFDLLYKLLSTSMEIDGVVLLALDAVYDNHIRNDIKTDLWVSNKFLAKKVQELNKRLVTESKAKQFYLGASVSPNNPQCLNELEWVKDNGAVLVKLIPSAQHININVNNEAFYKKLAELNLPLLCHVGPEYSFPEGIRCTDKDNVECLRKPLDTGVKVIAAHCASPVFPGIDSDYSEELRAMMDKYNKVEDIRLWTDTSALSLATRLPVIRHLKNLFPSEWMVHGTDFPIPIDDWQHLPFITENVTPEEYEDFCNTKNPFDKDVKIKRAHGFSDEILLNGAKALSVA